MGPEDHIQLDLGDPAATEAMIPEIRARLAPDGGMLHALVNNAAISPKGEGGARLGTLRHAGGWVAARFSVNFFAHSACPRVGG
jgi:NAD(P)-dependent dehydrogenase (short-subunit alcohol dehydrogenase family)